LARRDEAWPMVTSARPSAKAMMEQIMQPFAEGTGLFPPGLPPPGQSPPGLAPPAQPSQPDMFGLHLPVPPGLPPQMMLHGPQELQFPPPNYHELVHTGFEELQFATAGYHSLVHSSLEVPRAFYTPSEIDLELINQAMHAQMSWNEYATSLSQQRYLSNAYQSMDFSPQQTPEMPQQIPVHGDLKTHVAPWLPSLPPKQNPHSHPLEGLPSPMMTSTPSSPDVKLASPKVSKDYCSPAFSASSSPGQTWPSVVFPPTMQFSATDSEDVPPLLLPGELPEETLLDPSALLDQPCVPAFPMPTAAVATSRVNGAAPSPWASLRSWSSPQSSGAKHPQPFAPGPVQNSGTSAPPQPALHIAEVFDPPTDPIWQPQPKRILQRQEKKARGSSGPSSSSSCSGSQPALDQERPSSDSTEVDLGSRYRNCASARWLDGRS